MVFCNLASMHVQFHGKSRQWTIPFLGAWNMLPLFSSGSGCMAVFFTSIAKATGTAYLRITGLSKCKQNSSFQTGFQSLKASVGRWTLSWKQQNVHSSQRNPTGRAALRSDFRLLFRWHVESNYNSFKHKLSQIEVCIFFALPISDGFSSSLWSPCRGFASPKCMLLEPRWQASLLHYMNHWHLSGQVEGLWSCRTCHVLALK